MNNQEFIYWLGGFVDAVGQEGPTSEQWETIVSKLNQVGEPVSFPIYPKQPNTGPVPLPNVTFPYGAPIPVTCEGTSTTSGGNSVVVTDGFIQDLSVTRAKPQFMTLTTTTLPKGVNVNYTANLPEDL